MLKAMRQTRRRDMSRIRGLTKSIRSVPSVGGPVAAHRPSRRLTTALGHRVAKAVPMSRHRLSERRSKFLLCRRFNSYGGGFGTSGRVESGSVTTLTVYSPATVMAQAPRRQRRSTIPIPREPRSTPLTQALRTRRSSLPLAANPSRLLHVTPPLLPQSSSPRAH
jgi:hypothetical protein